LCGQRCGARQARRGFSKPTARASLLQVRVVSQVTTRHYREDWQMFQVSKTSQGGGVIIIGWFMGCAGVAWLFKKSSAGFVNLYIFIWSVLWFSLNLI